MHRESIIGNGNVINNKDFNISQKKEVVFTELFTNYNHIRGNGAYIIIFRHWFT